MRSRVLLLQMPIKPDPLDALPFAGELKPDELEHLRRHLTERALGPGVDILSPGDVVDGVYFVRSGAIRVYYVDPNGREGTLYWIEPRQSCILALNSLFAEIPYPAWAQAAEQGAEIVTISGSVFRSLFSKHGAVQRFLFEQLSSRVFSLMQILEQSMRLPQEQRLILLLLALADADGGIHISHDQLARHLGTVREVVTRLLRDLVGQGLVESAPRRIVILDRSRMESMVPR